mgnify:CR=1 FL=1
MTHPPLPEQEDPDIIQVVLQRVRALAPALDEATMERIDHEVRSQYAGLRVRIPKRGKHLTPEQRAQARIDAISSMPTQEVLKKHKISLATLYRLAKEPPPTP